MGSRVRFTGEIARVGAEDGDERTVIGCDVELQVVSVETLADAVYAFSAGLWRAYDDRWEDDDGGSGVTFEPELEG